MVGAPKLTFPFALRQVRLQRVDGVTTGFAQYRARGRQASKQEEGKTLVAEVCTPRRERLTSSCISIQPHCSSDTPPPTPSIPFCRRVVCVNHSIRSHCRVGRGQRKDDRRAPS